MSSSGPRHPSLTRQEKRDKRLAAIIAKQVAKAVSDVYENVSKSSEESRTEAPKATTKAPFCFKQFKSCGPKEFTGEDGPTALFQWFDSIEVTLRQSGCPDNLRTLNATGVFQSRALDWWIAERNKRGNDAAYGLSWDELKEVMLEEFCPPHERQKLEDEFWHIQQKDGDNPATIEATYLLAAEINDKRVKVGFWDKPSKSLHQVTVAPTTEPTASSNKKRNKRKNRSSNKKCALTVAPIHAAPAQQRQVAAPVANAPLSMRAYTRPHPLCPTCTYHHPTTIACHFCTHYNMYGHFTASGRYGPR
ncbi:putative retrotransposon gag domain-containing protein [Helianthus anomalus]